MKITPKKLALGLHESVEGKSESQIKNAIKNFVEILARLNMLSKAEKIREEFEKIWNSKYGIVECEVVSANKLNKSGVKSVEKRVIEDSAAEKVVITEKIDKNILGGIIIKYGDKVFDASLKTILSGLKEKLAK